MCEISYTLNVPIKTNYYISDFQEDTLCIVLNRTGYGSETSNYSITWDHKFFERNTTYVFLILPPPLNMTASLVLEINDNITVTLQNNVSYNVTIAACPYRSPVTEFNFSKININYLNYRYIILLLHILHRLLPTARLGCTPHLFLME